MRKKFTKNKKQIKKEAKARAITVMTKEMRKIFNGFYDKVDRLESEWNLCMSQYEEILEKGFPKEATFDARMQIRRISTYWNARKTALERALDTEVLAKFKTNRELEKQRNELKKNK